jgi:hypothetical protein
MDYGLIFEKPRGLSAKCAGLAGGLASVADVSTNISAIWLLRVGVVHHCARGLARGRTMDWVHHPRGGPAQEGYSAGMGRKRADHAGLVPVLQGRGGFCLLV